MGSGLTRRGLLWAAVGTAALGATRVFASPRAPMFDGHIHLIADDERAYPRAPATPPPPGAARPPGGLPPGVGGQAGGRFGGAPKVDPDAERVVAWMADEGVVRAAAVQKKAAYGFDPRYTIDASDRHADLFAPIVVLDAEREETAAALERMVQEHGVAGIRLTGAPAADGSFPWMDSAVAHRTWDVAERHGLVMDLMVTNIDRSGEAVPTLTRLARAYPHARLVLDHAGYPPRAGAPGYGFDPARAGLARLPNLYLKITTINFDLLREAELSPAGFVRHVVAVHGADHVLWGSDVGNSAGAYHDMCERARSAAQGLGSAQQRALLHDTGARVFVRGGTRRA